MGHRRNFITLILSLGMGLAMLCISVDALAQVPHKDPKKNAKLTAKQVKKVADSKKPNTQKVVVKSLVKSPSKGLKKKAESKRPSSGIAKTKPAVKSLAKSEKRSPAQNPPVVGKKSAAELALKPFKESKLNQKPLKDSPKHTAAKSTAVKAASAKATNIKATNIKSTEAKLAKLNPAETKRAKEVKQKKEAEKSAKAAKAASRQAAKEAAAQAAAEKLAHLELMKRRKALDDSTAHALARSPSKLSKKERAALPTDAPASNAKEDHLLSVKLSKKRARLPAAKSGLKKSSDSVPQKLDNQKRPEKEKAKAKKLSSFDKEKSEPTRRPAQMSESARRASVYFKHDVTRTAHVKADGPD